jgi:branched-subunit amino acid ABC-type transport system permease component
MSVVSVIINQFLNGLQAGSIYALVALGYSMVYGIIMLLNFAHGDIIMVWVRTRSDRDDPLYLPPMVAVLAAVLGCTLLGMLIGKRLIHLCVNHPASRFSTPLSGIVPTRKFSPANHGRRIQAMPRADGGDGSTIAYLL